MHLSHVPYELLQMLTEIWWQKGPAILAGLA